MTRSLSRRSIIRGAAGASAAAVMGVRGFSPRGAFAQDPTSTPEPTPTPISLGEGDIKITLWTQDFGPTVSYYQRAAAAYVESQSNVQVIVQALGFDDLLAKMIPSIAAGNEADILMGYTDWYVATDVSKLFLPLDDIMGGKAELEKSLFPSTLTTLDLPDDHVYYVPYAAGIRGAATTNNVAHYQEAGIDYMGLSSWEDLVAAGQTLTQREGDKVTRAGLSPATALLTMVKTFIWQTGGEFYDQESGVWSLSSPEGEAAMQRLYDLYWGDSATTSFDLISKGTEYTGVEQGLVSTNFDGAWAVGVHEASVEGLDIDCFPTPPLKDAVADVVYPEHIGVTTLSRRLAKDEKKLEHCVAIMKNLLSADALIEMTNEYSGTLCSKLVYEDPRINDTKYGPISKRIAEGVWDRSRFPRDHVANQGPAATEVERGLRQEITITEALANADAYLNDQEKQARERLGK